MNEKAARQLNLRLAEEQVKRLKIRAAELDTSMQDLVAWMIRRHFVEAPTVEEAAKLWKFWELIG